MQPLVTIIFPFYNAEQFMKHALDSVLNQDYSNLEIVCINDGSNDSTALILEEYSKKDSRVVIINNEKNLGLIASLNNALEFVKGEYFARMDADDYSTPNRISRLVNYLNSNLETQLVSSGYNYFKQKGISTEYVSPIAINSKALQVLSVFATPITHAALCGRTSLLKNKKYKYDSSFAHAEDFELFSRLTSDGVKMANINEPLYWVRLHDDSVSKKYASEQTVANIAILKRNLKLHLNYTTNASDLVLEIVLCRAKKMMPLKALKEASLILDLVTTYFASNHKVSKQEWEEINKFVSVHKLNMVIQCNKVRFKNLGIGNISFFLKSLVLLNPAQIVSLVKKIFKFKA